MEENKQLQTIVTKIKENYGELSLKAVDKESQSLYMEHLKYLVRNNNISDEIIVLMGNPSITESARVIIIAMFLEGYSESIINALCDKSGINQLIDAKREYDLKRYAKNSPENESHEKQMRLMEKSAEIALSTVQEIRKQIEQQIDFVENNYKVEADQRVLRLKDEIDKKDSMINDLKKDLNNAKREYESIYKKCFLNVEQIDHNVCKEKKTKEKRGFLKKIFSKQDSNKEYEKQKIISMLSDPSWSEEEMKELQLAYIDGLNIEDIQKIALVKDASKMRSNRLFFYGIYGINPESHQKFDDIPEVVETEIENIENSFIPPENQQKELNDEDEETTEYEDSSEDADTEMNEVLEEEYYALGG